MNRSAAMPGRNAPMRPSNPAVRAPPIVAALIASAAVGGPGSGWVIAASPAKSFMVWNMFWESLQLQLSQPSATLTPFLIYVRMGATPQRVFRLPTGLSTTLAPPSAIDSISAGFIHTLCARLVRGVSRPTRLR